MLQTQINVAAVMQQQQQQQQQNQQTVYKFTLYPQKCTVPHWKVKLFICSSIAYLCRKNRKQTIETLQEQKRKNPHHTHTHVQKAK